MAEQAAQTPEKRLSVVKIYVKDFSFESPQAPAIFNAKEWAPSTNLNLRSSHSPVGDTLHEVVLTITVEAKEKESDKTIFLVELQQAGAFLIRNLSAADLAQVVSIVAPNYLMSFARATVADLVSKGGFPPFLLPLVTFEALHARAQQQAAQGDHARAEGLFRRLLEASPTSALRSEALFGRGDALERQ